MDKNILRLSVTLALLVFALSPLVEAAETNDSTVILHFPTDRTVGMLEIKEIVSPETHHWKPLGVARGDVEAPTDKLVSFTGSKKVLTDYSFLSEFEKVRINFIWLGDTKITDEGLAHLSGLESLETLCLQDTAITDAGLKSLSGLKSLKWLMLSGTDIGDNGLAHLRPIRSLTRLTLSGTQITDNGLVHLKGMESLSSLWISSCQITDDGLAHLKELSSLRELMFGGNKITDAGVAHLRGLTQCERLSLAYCDGTITDAALVNLEGMTALVWLNLSGSQITDEGLALIARNHPKLQKLELDDTWITDEGMIYIGRLSSLRQLFLEGTRTTEAGLLPNLRRLESLEYVTLLPKHLEEVDYCEVWKLRFPEAKRLPNGNCQISGSGTGGRGDEDWDWFRQELASREYPKMSRAALDELKRALPECDVRYNEVVRPQKRKFFKFK